METSRKNVKQPDDEEGWSIVRHKEDVGSDGESVEVISDDSDSNASDEVKEAVEGEHELEVSTTLTGSTVDSEASSRIENVPEHEELPEVTNSSSDENADLADFDPLGPVVSSLSNVLHHLAVHNGEDADGMARSNYMRAISSFLRVGLITSALLAFICSLLVSSYLVHKIGNSDANTAADLATTPDLQELDQVFQALKNSLTLERKQRLREILLKLRSKEFDLDKLMVHVQKTNTQASGTHKTDVLKENPNPISQSFTQPANGKFTISNAYPTTKETAADKELPVLKIEPTPAVVKKNSTNLPVLQQTGDKGNEKKRPTLADPQLEEKLTLVKQDILAVQKLIYNQITNSFLDNKINWYKNLLKAELDASFDTSGGNPIDMNILVFKKVQNAIAKSSEFHFEHWHRFYSLSLLPKFQEIVDRLNSLSNEWKPLRNDGRTDDVYSTNLESDDFFIRTFTDSQAPVKREVPISEGFDWKNLNKRIRESLAKMRRAASKGRQELNPVVENQEREEKSRLEDELKDVGRDFTQETTTKKENVHKKENTTGDSEKRAGEAKKSKHSHHPGRLDKGEKVTNDGRHKNDNENRKKCKSEGGGEYPNACNTCSEYSNSKRRKKDQDKKEKKGKPPRWQQEKMKRKNFEEDLWTYVSDMGKTLEGIYNNQVNFSEIKDGLRRMFKDVLGEMVGSQKFEAKANEKSHQGPEGIYPNRRSFVETLDDGTTDDGTTDDGTTDDVTTDDGTTDDDTQKSWHRVGSCQGDRYRKDPSDTSWFLSLGRHRSFLRRRGIHLDEDGSWYISSARHRARMREIHRSKREFK